MIKPIFLATLAMASFFAWGQAPAQVADLDLSNEVDLPGCSLNIKFKIRRQSTSREWQALGVRAIGKVTVLQISMNGKKVATPADFWTSQLVEANRIKAPFYPISCGFALDTGDASESGQLLIGIEKNRIAWIEQWDIHGRRHSRTVFDYPKVLVFN